MGYQNEKIPAGETTGVNGVSDGDDLNHRQHATVNCGGGKAQSAAERLLENGGENLLDAGLRAADRGWKIFPCKSDKTPLVQWSQAATTDPVTIAVWAKRWPGALWGRALPQDVVVVDLDMKHGKNGIREFEKLQSCNPEQFDAPRVATATGGLHIYTDAAGCDFKNTTDKIAPGVDTKTGGGYEQEEQTQQSEKPWLKPGEQLLIRRMGKGIPTPVAFLVDGLFHEIGTGTIVSKYLGGKTFVAMALVASVSTGRPFAGRSVLRQGAVLWLAAEGEREVDKRVRAAVTALGCDPDQQPIYVQIASVPKLLADKGEANVMAIVNQVRRAAKAEFDLPLVLVVIDTMIKSAGYKKSENDAVEVNNMIRVMENISIRAKCFVLALDHMGKNEELGARGSSDKPSSFDVYIELKSNGGGGANIPCHQGKGRKG